jgi:inhibitor of cysteine peptidase
MQRYDGTAKVIRVTVGETFALALEGNPSTGYTWQADVDDRHLEQIAQEFEPTGKGVGAAGHEVCRFHALKTGKTRIALAYQRPWDREARETRQIEVVIE